MVQKKWDAEVIYLCKNEFGLSPDRIKQILRVLCMNDSLDVEKLFEDMDKLKCSLQESNQLIASLLSSQTQIKNVQSF